MIRALKPRTKRYDKFEIMFFDLGETLCFIFHSIQLGAVNTLYYVELNIQKFKDGKYDLRSCFTTFQTTDVKVYKDNLNHRMIIFVKYHKFFMRRAEVLVSPPVCSLCLRIRLLIFAINTQVSSIVVVTNIRKRGQSSIHG